MSKREQLAEIDPEILLLPPEYDAALVGYLDRACQSPIAVYHQAKIIEILVGMGNAAGLDDEAAYQGAIDHFEYNVKGAWLGEYTPGFIIMFADEDLWF